MQNGDDSAHLVRMIVMPPVEVLVQELDKRRVPAPPPDQLRHVMHDVERVCPHVALRPARVLASPRPVSIARLHEAGLVVEDAERCGEGALAQLGRPVILGESGGQH